MHRLLDRQLEKCFGATEGLGDAVDRLVEMVGDAYAAADDDRAMLERSMELSSRELLARNSALADAEKKFRAIFENSTEGIFQLSATWQQFISANPAMADILGYESPEDLIRNVVDVTSQVCTDPARYDEAVEAMKRDGVLSQFEFKARRKDGSIIWGSASMRPVCDDAGNVMYYEGTMRDITKRKQADAERQEMQGRMMTLSRQAGMAEVATGVLHNVGNVLNSINVAASLAADKLRSSKLGGLQRAIDLITDHQADLGQFLTADEKGKQLPNYLIRLCEVLVAEQKDVQAEIDSLLENLEHVKRIVTSQQDYARAGGVNETVLLSDLVEDALRLNSASFERHRIELFKQFDPLPPVNTDRHRVLQILVNLVTNARHAMRDHQGPRKLTIRIALSPADSSKFMIQVIDTGVGIPKENLTRIFSHGFTTKPGGHGFGLHSSALAAKSMSGSLAGHSDGTGTGATFTLELPLVAAAVERAA